MGHLCNSGMTNNNKYVVAIVDSPRAGYIYIYIHTVQ